MTENALTCITIPNHVLPFVNDEIAHHVAQLEKRGGREIVLKQVENDDRKYVLEVTE